MDADAQTHAWMSLISAQHVGQQTDFLFDALQSPLLNMKRDACQRMVFDISFS